MPEKEPVKSKVKSIQWIEGRNRWGVITDPAIKRQLNRERVAREKGKPAAKEARTEKVYND